jgi:hypothetical protein
MTLDNQTIRKPDMGGIDRTLRIIVVLGLLSMLVFVEV